MTSAAIDLLAIDEEVESGLRDELTARLVNRGGKIVASATMVEGQPWLADMEAYAAEGNPDYFCERLRSDLNEHLDSRLLRQWMTELGEEERLIRIFGHSRRSSGLVYPEWDPKKHICEPFDLPEGTVILCSLDPGPTVFAGIWVALCPDGHDYIIACMYERHAELGEVACRIREIEGWHLKAQEDPLMEESWEDDDQTIVPALRIADHHETRRLMTGEAGVIDQLMDRYGIMCEPSYHGTIMYGVQPAKRWLRPLMDGVSGLRIWNTALHLEDFAREITRYRWVQDTTSFRQHGRRIEPIRRENHLMDCLKNMAVTIEDYRAGRIDLPISDPDPVANEILRQARLVTTEDEAQRLAAEAEWEVEQKRLARQRGDDLYARQFDVDAETEIW